MIRSGPPGAACSNISINGRSSGNRVSAWDSWPSYRSVLGERTRDPPVLPIDIAPLQAQRLGREPQTAEPAQDDDCSPLAIGAASTSFSVSSRLTNRWRSLLALAPPVFRSPKGFDGISLCRRADRKNCFAKPHRRATVAAESSCRHEVHPESVRVPLGDRVQGFALAEEALQIADRVTENHDALRLDVGPALDVLVEERPQPGLGCRGRLGLRLRGSESPGVRPDAPSRVSRSWTRAGSPTTRLPPDRASRSPCSSRDVRSCP